MQLGVPQFKMDACGLYIYWKFDRSATEMEAWDAADALVHKFLCREDGIAGYDGDDLVQNRVTVRIKADAYRLLDGKMICPIRLN